ncbi:MAG TPA: zf-TFIIB domain-containing protein [Polyangiales bacterium]|jgi:Zn-finger nucleic acid-binding protein|nr:zf-TFIIB domain-containing protein [Polyangiales bacterium]
MHCPRCETNQLDERDRDGVTVDICRSCRGVWLDRGELEKLIARTTAELDEYEQRPQVMFEKPPSQSYSQPYRHDDPYRHKHRRKKSWVESLGDIFD